MIASRQSRARSVRWPRGQDCRVLLTGTIVWCGLLVPFAGSSQQAPSYPHATAEDMAVFRPFIGTWLGPIRGTPAGDSIRFAVRYAWFGPTEEVVKLTIEQRWIGSDRAVVTQEGFYGIHPAEDRVYYVGVTFSGRTAFGGLTEFDLETNRRVTLMVAPLLDGGAPTQVRDEFTVVDENGWRSRTTMLGEDGQWSVVNDAVYRREGSS